VFDGSRPVPVGMGQVRQWFYDNSSPSYRYKTQCVFDRQNNVVWICYCSTSATTPDSALVYHLLSKKWGKATLSIEAALNYIASGVTIDGLDAISATIDGLSAYSFDSQFWSAGGRAFSAFNTSHQLQLMTGVSGTTGFTTGDAGNDDVVSLLSRIRLRFEPGYSPSTSSVTTYYKMTEGGSLTTGQTGTIDDGKFDVLQSARFHRAGFTFTGDVRVTGMGAVLTPESGR